MSEVNYYGHIAVCLLVAVVVFLYVMIAHIIYTEMRNHDRED